MKRTHLLYRVSAAALTPVLALAVGASAYAQNKHDQRDDHRHSQQDDRDNQGNDQQRHDQGDDQRYNQGNRQSHGNQGGNKHGYDDRHYNQGKGHAGEFHFDNGHRERFSQHYRDDADRWRDRHDRVSFAPGQRIPVGYRVQPVPVTYYRGAPPPPPGYRYGYYQGYVVAYDPSTRLIGDVLDLIGAGTSR